MDMHAAALPPRQPEVDQDDAKHPLFRQYMEHRSFCSAKMIRADSFADWLRHREAEAVNNAAAQHPQYPEFLRWMWANQGGARRCPAGEFPHNFHFWQEGGRW